MVDRCKQIKELLPQYCVRCSDYDKLQKENDELRTALSLFTEYAEVYGDQPFYEIPRVKMMIAKEVIDKKGDDA